jgi:hypothetical protein
MSTIILTHSSCCCIMGQGTAYLQIQVILDVTYTIKFTFRPIGSRPYDAPQESDIRDIPYIPNAILEAIKLMNLTVDDIYGGASRILNGLKQILTSTLQDEFRSEIKSQEITKIKKEHDITSSKLQDDLRYAQSQLTQTESKIQTYQKDFDKWQCDKIALQKMLENKLQEIDQLQITNIEMQNKMKKIKTVYSELSDEKTKLCEKNKRFLEMINNEKIKNSSLTDKLNDMTELYESLLNTTY